MDAINRSATGLIGLVERYGMALVLLFVLDIFMPDLAPKVELIEQDLSEVTTQNSGSNMLKQLFWLGMFAGYLMLHLVDRLRILRQNFWIWILLMWTTVLIGTASSDYFNTSIKRAFFQFIFLFVVFSATYYAYRNRTLRICVWFSGMVVIGLTLYTLATGVGSNTLGLSGYTNAKNVLGAYIAILFVMTRVAEFTEGRKVPFSFVFKATLLALLLLTQSKTSLAVLVIFMIMARTDLLLVMLTNLMLVTGCFVLFVFWPAISFELGDYWHLSQHVPSTFMTNRGEIWNACYQDLEAFGKLFTGWGYASYFGVKEVPFGFNIKWSFLQYINSAHNGYIGILVQFGLFLAIPIYFALVGLVFRVRNLVLQAALLFPVIHNITESSILRDQHAVWFSFVWMIGVGLLIANRTRQISIVQGLQELRIARQVQWRNQDAALEKARERVAPYLPLEEPNIRPANQPIAPAALPQKPPTVLPEQPGEQQVPEPEQPPVLPYGPNVIVAHWAKPEIPDIPPSHRDGNDRNVVALEDAIARKKAKHTAPQPGIIKAMWSGVELTLVTENIATPLANDQQDALNELAAQSERIQTNSARNDMSNVDEEHRLDQVANGLVAGQWHGRSILFVTDGITQPVDGSTISTFHHD